MWHKYKASAWVGCAFIIISFGQLTPFSLIRNFRKQNTRGNVSNISVDHTCYRQIGSKSTNHSHYWDVKNWRSHWWLWLVNFDPRSIDNTYDWRKFWKCFRGCCVGRRVSTKTVVRLHYIRGSSVLKVAVCSSLLLSNVRGYYKPLNKHRLSFVSDSVCSISYAYTYLSQR